MPDSPSPVRRLHRKTSRVNARLVTLALAASLCGSTVPADEAPRKSAGTGLVGSWRLTDYIDTPEGGKPAYAFGREPVGLFIFTADGHASISIMRNPPDVHAPTEDPDPDACFPGWYCSYFGTYSVDLKAGRWVTHVSGGNIPAYTGTDQPRTFTLRGDTLTIRESYVADGKRVDALRVLKRD